MAKTEQLNSAATKEKVKAFIINNFLLEAGQKVLSDDDSFLEKGIVDSTGVLELVSFIEKTFGFRVEDEELIPDNLDSLSKVTAYVTKKLSSSR